MAHRPATGLSAVGTCSAAAGIALDGVPGTALIVVGLAFLAAYFISYARYRRSRRR